MSSRGFKIDANFDPVIENGLFAFVKDVDEVAQRSKHELLTFVGEVIDEPERGLNVLGIMLSETSSKAQRKDELRRVLAYIPEITINSIVEELDRTSRVARYYISLRYQGINTEINIEVA